MRRADRAGAAPRVAGRGGPHRPTGSRSATRVEFRGFARPDRAEPGAGPGRAGSNQAGPSSPAQVYGSRPLVAA
ncbi:hypothetical protein DEJ51_28585 [Streptomyces venezuelae]|uniref:Uncharacterized protein n=1 Tax=Streptomyces venezuelae TaxID=54571 RepID=A0A5P2DR16_STRVZ|nr:hypothetical protein DEJ51_28585 [Streptomyces venezuelae]